MPLVQVTYSTGFNVGNIYRIWQSDATSIDSALQTVQPIVERLKQNIPQYHMRAMQREAYAKFWSCNYQHKKISVATSVQGLCVRFVHVCKSV